MLIHVIADPIRDRRTIQVGSSLMIYVRCGMVYYSRSVRVTALHLQPYGQYGMHRMDAGAACASACAGPRAGCSVL